MKSVAEWIYLADKQVFLDMRTRMGNPWLEQNAGTLGDWIAWTPLLIFLMVLLYLARPGKSMLAVFFGMATFILGYQAATLMANYLMHPSPWRLEYFLVSLELPAFGRGNELSLPDWPFAAFSAAMHYTFLRLRAWGENRGIRWLWLATIPFALLRIYAGYTYPLGIALAFAVGLFIGWVVFQLARNIDVLAEAQERAQQDSDE